MKSSTRTILVLLLFIFSSASMIPITSAQGDWLTGWDYRKPVTIIGAAGCGTDYQFALNVTYDSDMQVDFADIRFTDNDGKTLLDHWRQEKTNSMYAYFWVEVADSLETSAVIYMYWGNSTVSTASNGDNTFLFFDDFSGTSLNTTKWNNTHGSEPDDFDVDSGIIDFLDEADERIGIVTYASDSWDSEIAWAVNMYWDSTWQFLTFGLVEPDPVNGWYGGADDAAYFETSGADSIVVENDGENDHLQPYSPTSGSWNVLSIYLYGPTHIEFYDNYVEKYDWTTGIPNENLHIIISTIDTQNPNRLNVDWTFVRKMIIDLSGVFGEWNEINTARFIFPVGWTPEFQFGYDMFFIALGLVMIPFSTLYLVRGGRKEMSRDKLFLGLIIFVMGLGLLIGGITP